MITGKAKEDDRLVRLLNGKPLLELERRLGEGKAGVVYEAEVVSRIFKLNPGLRIVAKFYKPEILMLSHQDVRLKREAEISYHVVHPNVVEIFGLVDTNRGKCLLMEYVSGGTLRDLLKAGMPKSGVDLCIQLLEGLTALHEKELIHRDLKPENLLLTDDHSCLKIGDFGVVRNLAEMTVTTDNRFLGTIRYAAPEYLFEGVATPRSDQYSAGAIIYEVLAGVPLVDRGGTFASQVLKVRETCLDLKSKIETHTHEQLVRNAVLRNLLAKTIEGRFEKTKDALYAFRDTVRSLWWKDTVKRYRREYRSAKNRDSILRKIAQRELEKLRYRGEIDRELDRVEDAIEQIDYAKGIDICPVCKYETVVVPPEDYPLTCGLCGYSCTSSFGHWSILMESLPADSKSFSLVALAAALEGHSTLPSSQSLEIVSGMRATNGREIKKLQKIE